MAQAPISLLPETLDLKLYGGDGVRLRLVVTNPQGGAINLDGTIAAQIRASRTNSTIRASFTTEITDAPGGIAYISLTGAQTADLHSGGSVERFTGVWDVQWTPQGSEPITILQGAVESNLDVTRS
jgi:hypothetical protein